MYDASQLVDDVENELGVVFTEEQGEALEVHAEEILSMAWEDMTKPLRDDLTFFAQRAFKGKLEKFKND